MANRVIKLEPDCVAPVIVEARPVVEAPPALPVTVRRHRDFMHWGGPMHGHYYGLTQEEADLEHGTVLLAWDAFKRDVFTVTQYERVLNAYKSKYKAFLEEE